MMVNHQAIMALGSSALLLHCAYVIPVYCDWFIFIFLVPLFYYALRFPSEYNGLYGLLWGVIFFGLHLTAVFHVILEQGNGVMRWFFVLLLWLYCAAQSAPWFWSTNWIISCIPAKRVWHAAVWCFTTFFYFVWLYLFFLKPLGFPRGYCFSMPLVPLAEHYQWLSLLWLCTTYGLLICLIASSMAVSYALVFHCKESFIVALLCMVPFLYGWVISPQEQRPNYLVHWGYICPSRTNNKHPLDVAQHINQLINSYVEEHRSVRYLFMPESAFPFPLYGHPECIELLQYCATSDEYHLIIGSYQKRAGTLQNCLFEINNTCIRQPYVKTVLMPFIEYVPWPFSRSSSIATFFLKDSSAFLPKEIEQGVSLPICDQFSLQASICAELFLGCPSGEKGLLCAVNETRFSYFYMRHLMFLYAKYWALEHNKPLVYIGFEHGGLIGQTGRFFPLNKGTIG